MSDVSVLSHEYKTASDLSRLINETLILLKKVHFGLPGISEEDCESLGGRSKMLADVLTALTDLVDDRQAGRAEGTLEIPGMLVARLQREHGGAILYYLEDLRRVASRLAADVSKLDERDLHLLDELASATDAEASRVFRQMMRR